MSGEPDADAARAALVALAGQIHGREVENAVAASPIADDATEAELWGRIGRVLRERDPAGYREMRALGLNLAALLDAPIEN